MMLCVRNIQIIVFINCKYDLMANNRFFYVESFPLKNRKLVQYKKAVLYKTISSHLEYL